MRKKRVAALLSISAMIVMLSACGGDTTSELMGERKEELVNMYLEKTSEYDSLSQQYQDLNAKLNALYEEKSINPGITSLGDGSADVTLNSVLDRVQFNEVLQYPSSSTLQDTSSVLINESVTVSVRDTWTVRLSNGTAELKHDGDGISGSINVSGVTEYLVESTIKDAVVTPWTEQVSNGEIEYGNIFLSGTTYGTQSKCDIMIDGSPARLQAGLVNYGDLAVSYVFIYEGQKDTVKEEVIKNIINSITIYGNALAVE